MAQTRINRVKLVYESESAELCQSVGWCYNKVKGEWISNKNTINERLTINELKDFNSIITRTIKYREQLYYVLLILNTTYRTDNITAYIFSSNEYLKLMDSSFTTTIRTKRKINGELVSSVNCMEIVEVGGDQISLLDLINSELQEQRGLLDPDFIFAIRKSDNHIRFHLPYAVYDSSSHNFSENYYETEINEFIRLLDFSSTSGDLSADKLTSKESENDTLNFAEQMPEFPGGQEAMLTFLSKNIQYPPMARENRVEGHVVLQFVVDKVGNISNIEIVSKLGWGLEEEAIRAVKMMPAWKPAKQNGKPVTLRMILPIAFKLK